MIEVKNSEEINKIIEENNWSAGYFSHDECNVCKVLKPKFESIVNENFPKIKLFYCNIEKIIESKGTFSVFTVPTVIFFIDGKEFIRKSRNISLPELTNDIERVYNLYFE